METIQILMRSKSWCYKLYVRLPDEYFRHLASKLVIASSDGRPPLGGMTLDEALKLHFDNLESLAHLRPVESRGVLPHPSSGLQGGV